MTSYVSILTPCLNGAKTIAQTLESVSLQTYPAIEHLIIDGGSKDATRSLVAKYSPRASFVSRPGLNQSAALNAGCAIAKGDIVGWVNADDFYFDRDVVTHAVAAFEADTTVGLVYGDAVYIDAEGKVLEARVTPRFSRARLRRYSFIPQPTIFARKAVLERFPISEPLEFVMDAEWMLRLSEHIKFSHVPRLQAVFRYHGSSKLHTLGRAVYTSEVSALRSKYPQSAVRARAGRLVDGAANVLARLRGFVRLRSITEAQRHDFERILAQ